MPAQAKRYLTWTFLISYVCFGALLALQPLPGQQKLSAVQVVLLVAGCMGPLMGSAMSGMKNLRLNLPEEPSEWSLVALLLALHYATSLMLDVVAPVESTELRLWVIPYSFVLGAQVLGWQGVLQPALAQRFAWWKAALITGGLFALWFAPLLFVWVSPVRGDELLPYSVWLIGLTLLQTTVRRRTGSLLCTAVLTSIFFILAGMLPVQKFFGWLMAGAVDALLAFLYQQGVFGEDD